MEVAEKVVTQMSYKDFLTHKEEIAASLHSALETIIEEDSFGDDPPPQSICNGMPVVDSKTVMKLSPDVEELVGIEIDSKWLKKGGYNTNKETIDSLLDSVGKALQEKEQVLVEEQ